MGGLRLKKIAVLISGKGTNCQALIEAAKRGSLQACIEVVISNNPLAEGIKMAEDKGVATQIVDHRVFASREDFEQQLADTVASYQVDLIVLAGFMRKLTAGFVSRFKNRILNIHPSLLPRHRGLDTHKKVLACGDAQHGCTVHFVNEQLDAGPIVAFACLSVTGHDTEAALKERVHALEYQLYWRALNLVCLDKVFFRDDGLFSDAGPMPSVGLELPLGV